MASTTSPDATTATNGGDLHDTNDQDDNNDQDDAHENGTTSDDGPLQTAEQILQCQFSTWYPTFSNVPAAVAAANSPDTSSVDISRKRRTNVTLKSIVLPLPPAVCEQFRAYLSADGVHLPIGAKVSNCMLTETDNAAANEWSSDDETDDDSDSDDKKLAETTPPLQFHFDDLTTAMEDAIAKLSDDDAGVVPKLNWSAPKDAVWINNGTMRCRSAGDVYLLLKSSDFCSYDAQHALLDNDNGNDVVGVVPPQPSADWPLELVLRKWCNLYPSQEFRCFVRDGELVAISQRQHSQHYPHVCRDQYLYRSLLLEFFDDYVVDNFPVDDSSTADTAVNATAAAAATQDSTNKNYVFDAYIDKKERVWLLDFNVWGRQTDALLWEWSELTELVIATDTDIHQPDIRVVETDRQVRQDPLASYRAPIDTVHAASKFDEFMTMCERPSVLKQEERRESNHAIE